MDCSLTGSSIHGIFQARVLEWGAIAFSVNAFKSLLLLVLPKNFETISVCIYLPCFVWVVDISPVLVEVSWAASGVEPRPPYSSWSQARRLWCWGSFSSVQSLSRVQLFATPSTVACQASLSITNSWSLLKLMSIELVMLSNHLFVVPFSSRLQSFPASGSP